MKPMRHSYVCERMEYVNFSANKKSNFVYQKVLSVGQVLLSIVGQELLYQKTAHEDDLDLECSNHFFRWALHNSVGLLLVSKLIPKMTICKTISENFISSEKTLKPTFFVFFFAFLMFIFRILNPTLLFLKLIFQSRIFVIDFYPFSGCIKSLKITKMTKFYEIMDFWQKIADLRLVFDMLSWWYGHFWPKTTSFIENPNYYKTRSFCHLIIFRVSIKLNL